VQMAIVVDNPRAGQAFGDQKPLPVVGTANG